MAYAPIALTMPQYENYANNYLKAYDQGTTTPLSMATDAAGGTLLAKVQIDAQGFPITAGNARFIPFIDGDYDLWLFPTSADADADDTSNAIQFADNLNAGIPDNNIQITVANKTEANTLTIVDGRKVFITSTPDGGSFTMRSGASVGTYDDDGGIYTGTKFTNGDGSTGFFRDNDGPVNVIWFGATGDNVTDDTASIAAAIVAAFALNANGASMYIPQGYYKIASTLNIPYGMKVTGDGQQNTWIIYSGTGVAIHAGYNTSTRSPGLVLRDFLIQCTSGTATALRTRGAVNSVFENIHIVMKDVTDDTKTDIGIHIDVVTPNLSSYGNLWSNIEVSQAKTGIKVAQGPTNQLFLNVFMNGGLSAGQTNGIAYDFLSGNDSTIINGNLENWGTGIYRRGAGGSYPTVNSYGLRYELNTIDIQLDGSSTWGGNKFMGSTQLSAAKVVDNTGSAKNWFDYNTGDDSLAWTPTDTSGATLTFTVTASTYTKNKNTISIFIDITWPTTSNTAQAQLGGLPFKCENEGTGGGYCHLVTGGTAGANYTLNNVDDSSALNIYKDNVLATNVVLSGVRLRCVVIYKGV